MYIIQGAPVWNCHHNLIQDALSDAEELTWASLWPLSVKNCWNGPPFFQFPFLGEAILCKQNLPTLLIWNIWQEEKIQNKTENGVSFRRKFLPSSGPTQLSSKKINTGPKSPQGTEQIRANPGQGQSLSQKTGCYLLDSVLSCFVFRDATFFSWNVFQLGNCLSEKCL